MDLKSSGRNYIDYVDKLLNTLKLYPVSPNMKPGEALGNLDTKIPHNQDSLENILTEFDNNILPGVNIWNHPGFMGYFNSSASEASILAELLSAAVNPNCMNWKSCPAGTELEELVIDWFREMVGLPECFWGILYEGGSLSNFHGLAAARENLLGEQYRRTGKTSKTLRAYITNQTHSSVHKALIILGTGLENIIEIPVNENFQMIPSELESQILRDKEAGYTPFCLIGTIGSTSCTAADPIEKINAIAKQYNVWLHIDASHAGTAAVVTEVKHLFKGWEAADSIVINPHKWMFLSLDTSILFIKKRELLKEAFSIHSEYLSFTEEDQVINYNDYGLTLGRKFKSLKLWMNFRYLGVEGIRQRITKHLELAKKVKSFIENHEELELMAPVPFSTVCFRFKPKWLNNQSILNTINSNLLEVINNSGCFFITHTKLNGNYVLRIVISGYRTEEENVNNLIELIAKNLLTIQNQLEKER